MSEPSVREIRLRIVEGILKHCTAEAAHNADGVAKIASTLESYVIGSTVTDVAEKEKVPPATVRKSKKTDNVDPFS